MFGVRSIRLARPAIAAMAAAAAASLALAGCASGKARIADAWRDPSYTGEPLRSVLVVAAIKDPVRRRTWEDAFVAALKSDNVQATPSYSIYAEDIPSAEVLQQRMGDGSFDGAILTRRVGAEDRKRYVPGYSRSRPVGIYYDPFWRSYRTAYERTHSPGYVENEKVVRYETSVSDLRADGKMLWVGTSEAFDPASPQQVSSEISKLIVPELRKQKLL